MKDPKIFLLPSWLFEPPDGIEPNPPIVSREQSLPFKELTWKNFERMIVRLVRKDGEIVDCFLYGTEGQEQEGIDILAIHSDRENLKICYQCKKVKKFYPSSIKKAVNKFLSGKWAEQAREFVLCIAVPLESTKQQEEIVRQRDRLSKKGIELIIWDAAAAGNLCEQLKNYPDLVDDFFGRPWVERFNGREAAESLGERLNGYEFGALRNRLYNLYSVLFVQHDPGIHTDGDKVRDYRERYVPADVTERTVATAITSVFQNKESSPSDDARLSGEVRYKSAFSSTSSEMAFDTRKPALDWIRDQQDCVILGEPGYGKSAFVSRQLLCPVRIASNRNHTTWYRYASSQ